MGVIINFPKLCNTEVSPKCLIKYTDGKTFSGNSVEEAILEQKDYWDTAMPLSDYLEQMRDRLFVITGEQYSFNTISELAEVLTSLGYIEVLSC